MPLHLQHKRLTESRTIDLVKFAYNVKLEQLVALKQLTADSFRACERI